MKPSPQNNVAFPQVNPVPNNRFRIRVIQVILLLVFVAVVLRLGQVQIIDSAEYREIAESQYKSKNILPAERGSIVDRTGNLFASSVVMASFAVDPTKAKDSALSISRTFDSIFGGSVNRYFKIIKSCTTRHAWLKRFVDMKYYDLIRSKDLKGVVSKKEPERLYFHNRCAGQLIGTTNLNDSGIAGLEKYFQKDLRGNDGYVIHQRDGRHKLVASVEYPRVEPRHGHNIYLTIDREIQQIAESELKKGAEKTKARAGIAIVMLPGTGEILAVAQYPQVDSDEFGKYQPEYQKLRAVTDIYEPGSVFKIVTAAAALENNLVNPGKKFNAENGIYRPLHRSRPIIDIHDSDVYSFEEAMEQSSNIVMAKISDIVGKDRFYKMARAFGFGTRTNIEFPGENSGVLKNPNQWSALTLNSLAFGYEVSATPLQIACAYAAIANGGNLMKPTILRKITDTSGKIIREPERQCIRSVISPSTSEILTRMLERVVEKGTGTNARIPGIRVAGKTGTAKKLINGEYRRDKIIASFAGFFPADDPKIMCLIMIDEPEGNEQYGSTVSAPVFRAIAEKIINTTDYVQSSNTLLTASDKRIPAFPAAPVVNGKSKSVVPNVRGLSIRRAVEILNEHNLKPSVRGTGIVIDQVPDAGSRIPGDRTVRLICQSRTSASIGTR